MATTQGLGSRASPEKLNAPRHASVWNNRARSVLPSHTKSDQGPIAHLGSGRASTPQLPQSSATSTCRKQIAEGGIRGGRLKLKTHAWVSAA